MNQPSEMDSDLREFAHGAVEKLAEDHGALPEVVYTPRGVRRKNQNAWAAAIADFATSRELLWRLVLRDVSSRHRQSVLGWIWVVLPPILAVVILDVLIENRSMSVAPTALPYQVHVLWSLSLWQLFAGCLTATTNSLTGAGSLVSKINFPKETLVIASVGHAFLDFFIRLLVIFLGLLWFDVALRWQLVFLPFVVLPTILLALGIGFVLSIANLILRDVANALGPVLTLGILVTPVFYPPPTTWPLSLINIINPFSSLLIASQDFIAYGSLTMPQPFFFSWALSVVLFLAGWHIFRLLLPRVSHHS